MKEVYFVRHGESEGNVTKVHHDPAGALTPEGERQAAFLSDRFAALEVDVVITSHYERARQTGQIINQTLQKPLEEQELFGEKRYPTEMQGLAPDDPLRVQLDEEYRNNFHDPNYRYSDEENFFDLKRRGQKALAHLLERPEEKILVVTHGWFLRVLISIMLYGDPLTSDEQLRVQRFFKTKNTGVTICKHDEENAAGGWQLITWMDHAHLGEPGVESD